MTRMFRSAIALAIGGFALGACSAGPTAKPPVAPPAASAGVSPASDAAVRGAMRRLYKDVAIDSVRPAPLPGYVEVTVGPETVYVSTDGKYLLTGNVIDVASRRNLTEASHAVARKALLRNVTASQMIVFAPKDPKYTVTVFTDVDCGYCRKLHSQIADYNRQGIAVDYLFFPRTGLGGESFDKAVSVWCAPDRRKALTDAKNGLAIPKGSCTNPVTMDFNLGVRVGVDGTPAIYTADGTQIGGYMTPAQMRAKLDELAAQPKG